jgi:hypothetical protein
MKSPQVTAFLKAFTHAHYHSKERLLTWRPRGTFDDALADEVIAMIELDETSENVPFHRYTDLSLLTDIRLKIGHVFSLSPDRRESPFAR